MVRSALKLRNRYNIKIFAMDFEKGAVGCACLYWIISLLISRKINYKTVFLFPHRTLRMGFLNNRKEYYTKLLSGEKGGPSELLKGDS